MKFKIIFLFFPLFIVGQSTLNEIEIIRGIDSYVEYVDSISFSLNEEMSYGVILPAHGRINGKSIEKIETVKKVLKIDKQILKMIYSEKKSKIKEEFIFYYKDLKLVYAEFLIYKKKKSTFFFITLMSYHYIHHFQILTMILMLIYGLLRNLD